jgi:hypothetical protein
MLAGEQDAEEQNLLWGLSVRCLFWRERELWPLQDLQTAKHNDQRIAVSRYDLTFDCRVPCIFTELL